MMKKKVSIAILTTLVLIMTVIPAAAFAGTDQKVIPKDKKGMMVFKLTKKGTKKERILQTNRMAPQSQLNGFLDMYKQWVIEEFEWDYEDSVEKENKYFPPVWLEVNEVYEEGRAAILGAKTFDELESVYWDYEWHLYLIGDLTKRKVTKDSDLSKIKTMYKKELDSEFKWMKKSRYNAYYWDMILDAVYIGKKEISDAKTFKAASGAYAKADDVFWEEAWSNYELNYFHKEVANALKLYLNLGLDKKDYTDAEWKTIIGIRDQALSDIKKKQSIDEKYMIFDNAADDLIKLTGVAFINNIYWWDDDEWDDWYSDWDDEDWWYDDYDFYSSFAYYPIILDQAYDLASTFWAYDEDNYSDDGYWRLYLAAHKAFKNVLKAETRSEAAAAHKKGINNMKKVLTKKQEIAALKKSQPKGLKVTKEKTKSVKVSWKKIKYVSRYEIYQATSKNGKYKKVGSTYYWNGSFTVKKLKQGKTYYFKVRGTNSWIDYGKTYYSKYSKPVKGVTKK